MVRRFVTSVPGSQTAPALSPDHVAVVRALAELDPDQRQVIVLRYLADLGPAEIAHELGLPEGTVKSRLLARSRTPGSPARRTRGGQAMPDVDVLRELSGQFHRPRFRRPGCHFPGSAAGAPRRPAVAAGVAAVGMAVGVTALGV